jgi:hypothetical protein
MELSVVIASHHRRELRRCIEALHRQTQDPRRFPGRLEFRHILGLLWFDVYESGPGGYTDWPVETSSSSSAAFAAGVGHRSSRDGWWR